jgi:hypothetical protein
MHIEMSTDRNIDNDSDLRQQIAEDIEAALSRFDDQLTRIEVHLSDVNADKGGSADMRCVLEARPAGQGPLAVTHEAATVAEACRGAASKLYRLLDTRFSRVEARRGRETIRNRAPS